MGIYSDIPILGVDPALENTFPGGRLVAGRRAGGRSGGRAGKLKKALHRTRDAAQNWMDMYIEAVEEMGFKRGTSSPCACWHQVREIRAVVHGDDFTALGHEEQLDWFREEMRRKFECKY